MNTILLQQTRDAILEHPKQFKMECYFGNLDNIDNIDKLTKPMPECGTAACIGGWALHLSRGHRTLKETILSMRSACWADCQIQASIKAREALKLTGPEAARLFHVMDWPKRFKKAFMVAPTAGMKAKVAAERINHFIATDGRE